MSIIRYQTGSNLVKLFALNVFIFLLLFSLFFQFEKENVGHVNNGYENDEKRHTNGKVNKSQPLLF